MEINASLIYSRKCGAYSLLYSRPSIQFICSFCCARV